MFMCDEHSCLDLSNSFAFLAGDLLCLKYFDDSSVLEIVLWTLNV